MLATAGDACWGTAANLRGHAYFYGGYQTAGGSTSFGEAGHLADQHLNGWRTLKIVVSSSPCCRSTSMAR